MKRVITSVIFSCVFISFTQGQIDSFIIKSRFFAHWLYFRMQENPLLSYEETHDGNEWKRPDKLLLPSGFVGDYLPDIKILPWYDQKHNSRDGFVSFADTDGLYIIEKGDGITGIKWDYFTYNEKTPIDTVHLNVYDSIFPYDNRFLVFIPNNGKIGFFSGNIGWDNFRELNMDDDLVGVAYIRGVQFGMQRLRRMPDEWLAGIRESLPEYPGWDFAFADRSFLTYGRLLITAPPNKAKDHLEFLFFSDHPEKTGDKEEVYYEFRYKFPAEIKSISERCMEKRKLTPEEVKKIRGTDLKYFFDSWRAFIEQEVEDE